MYQPWNRWQRSSVSSFRTVCCLKVTSDAFNKKTLTQKFYLTLCLSLVQAWPQRGRRCISVTSGRPGRRSNRLKRTQSSPPFLRISGEGWRWGYDQSVISSFLYLCLMHVSFTEVMYLWYECFLFPLCPLSRKGTHFGTTLTVQILWSSPGITSPLISVRRLSSASW